MPSSAKRAQRGRRELRKDKDATDTVTMKDSSPSRPAKRRKRTRSSDPADSNLMSGAASTPHGHGAEESSGTDDDHVVSQVTQQLKSLPVQACKDHANAIHEANQDGVKAYAKVAAQDWTFYITKLAVNIGRAPELSHGDDDEDDEAHVHIDLGPGKMVSREHASIYFDSKGEKWILQIKGRNGAKIDGQPLKPKALHPLTSGEIIEIGNVEMMFVLPSEISPLHVHKTFLQRCDLSPETMQTPSSSHRQPLIAPATVDHKQPGTPPSTQRKGNSTAKSPAVTTPAVMIGANGVDLSLDDNQHIKPQYSYAQMITQAILNAPAGKLNLNGIYTFIMNSYSYYRHQQASGWQNSIRHNLSLNKSFDKVARSTDEPGKGMKWQIVPDAREEMVRNAYKIGRGGHRGSSAPSSPNQLNYITQGPKDMALRDPASARKRRVSPTASPAAVSSFYASRSTPQPSSERVIGRNAAMTVDGSPLPRHRKSNKAALDSSISTFNPQSPTLTSSYLQDEGASFVTPAPPRIHPKLAPPSTAQRPSQHMPTSSPAPFWKYADINSTPLRPSAAYEFSPSKLTGGMPPQSSSPPRASKSPPSSPSKPQKQNSLGDIQQESEIPTAGDDQGFDLTK
ncbi:transcription factor [Conoideocrella luteorostrata]|uniref:Transcription factor n=1 Tax=Conoideocrella luteorostrata TaxID=1105319 RepID=A0AAJ0CY17_9HYPO|nr:transcription factor [Conoideocrella luteorostrata]